MKIKRIAAETTAEAAPDAIWALLADRSTWPSWSPLGSHSGVRPGQDGTPDGLGGVAQFVTGRYRVCEEIVEREAPRRLSYTLHSGLPLRDYLQVSSPWAVDGHASSSSGGSLSFGKKAASDASSGATRSVPAVMCAR